MSSENISAGAFSQASDLKKRILFTIIILIVYRLGTYVPLSGIDPLALKEIMSSSQKGLLGMFNMFSGGAVSRMALFALVLDVADKVDDFSHDVHWYNSRQSPSNS